MEALVAAAEFGEEAENLHIEPDEGDEEREGGVPLHVFGCAIGDAALDEVEVEDEVHGGDADDDEGEADADDAAAIDGGELEVEEAEDHLQEVEEGDGTGGGDDAEAELVSNADDAGAVDDEEGAEGAEGEGDGLHGDAGVANLKDGGDAAEDEAFAEGVGGGSDGRPLSLEDGDHGEDEPADEAEDEEAGGCAGFAGGEEGAPGEEGGGHGAYQQDAGFVDGAVEGHAGGAIDGDALKGFVIESGVGRSHPCHRFVSVCRRVDGA